MSFEFPQEDLHAIKMLASMPNASINQLIGSLKNASLSSDTDVVAKEIVVRVPSTTAEQLESVLDALYGLHYIRELSGVPRHRFLEDVVGALKTTKELEIDPREIPKLSSRFERLLDIEFFNLMAKAKRLQRDGERLYCDAKIVSDIRPVFGAKPSSRPKGAVITHVLKLGYHENGNHREFQVVLDAIDLDLLRDVLQRAQVKDKTLRNMLREANLPDMGV